MKNSIKTSSLFCLALVGTLFFTSCDKYDVKEPISMAQSVESGIQPNIDIALSDKKNNLSKQTLRELNQARAATAKYQNINNAYRDHYDNINVVIPNMGYHFMKLSLVDSVFDYRRPELLVYNKDKHGRFELVAVEYAVPIAASPNAAPEGFTGNNDVWEHNVEFGLWTLHAWIWKFNPEGIFNETNPLVTVL